MSSCSFSTGCVCCDFRDDFSRFSEFSLSGVIASDDWRYFCGYVSSCFCNCESVAELRRVLFDAVLSPEHGWRDRELDYLRGLFTFRSSRGIGSLSWDSESCTFCVTGYRKTIKSRRWRLMVAGKILLLYPCCEVPSDCTREQYSMHVYGLHEKCSTKYGKLMSMLYGKIKAKTL